MDLAFSNTDIFFWNYKFFTKKIMKNKILPLSVFIVFGIIFFIFYKGLEDTKIYTPDINIKNEIPVFNSKNFFSGENVKSLSIFEYDKIYLLNIWSSWCVPCRQEHPFLMNLNLDNKVNIIGMNYKDDLKNAKNFLKELGNPYKEIFVDLDGTIAIEWGAYGVPESFLIYNNEIIKKYIGPLNQQLIDEINLLIK
jgi:cytochrome c biogenesis protein CcmG/thiol:disulfide interchange protein DsbE